MTPTKPTRKPADWKKIKAALKEDAGGIAFTLAGLGTFLIGWTWGGNTHYHDALPIAWAGLGLALVAIGVLQFGSTSVRKLRVRLEALEALAGVAPGSGDAAASDEPMPGPSSTDPRGAKGA